MPWKECNKMDERLKFVARHLAGGKIAPLAREFGIITWETSITKQRA